MSSDKAICILIAEDNEVSREMMAQILRTRGYDVLMAVDGDSAIRVVETHKVDLVLVDLKMAPKGGFELLKYMFLNNIKIPSIIVTADDSSDLLVQASELGARGILHKPVSPDRLLESVQRVLRQIGYKPKPLAVETHITKFQPEELMRHAVELAQRNVESKKGGPFGAVVASKDGTILGEGVNGIISRADPTAHAEVMAIRQAAERLNCTDLKDCILYSSSEPTMMGKALIISVGIETVYYGLSHDEIHTLHSREELVRQAMSGKEKNGTRYIRMGHDEALAMFRNWETRPEKIHD